jgi:tetratricopeptide (TPR) repeat protein
MVPAVEQVLALAEEAGDLRLQYFGLGWRIVLAGELGDIDQVRDAIEQMERMRRLVPYPDRGMAHAAGAAALGLLTGDLVAAGRWIEEFAAVSGQITVDQLYPAMAFIQLREEGNLARVEPLLAMNATPDADPLWHGGLALLYLETGRPEEARRIVRELADRGFSDYQMTDGLAYGRVAVLAELCWALGEGEVAADLEPLLEQIPRCNLPVSSWTWAGWSTYYHGVARAAQGRWEEAEALLREAVDENRRMGARPWVARAETALAAVLDRRPPG